MKQIIRLGKFCTTVFWCTFFLNLAYPFPSEVYFILLAGGLGILGVHTLQAFVVIRKFKNQLPELSAHAVQVLIYGFFHFLEIQQINKKPSP